MKKMSLKSLLSIVLKNAEVLWFLLVLKHEQNGNYPQRRTHSLNVESPSKIHQHKSPKWGPPLEFIYMQPPERGSASRVHQHIAHQKGFRLQNSSTYSPSKGVCHQNSSTKGGPPLDFINQKGGLPLSFINQERIPSTKKGVRLQGQFLWIQRYSILLFVKPQSKHSKKVNVISKQLSKYSSWFLSEVFSIFKQCAVRAQN